MKRIILIAIALTVYTLSYAQEVCALNPDNELKLDSENGSEVKAGTIVGITNSIICTVGADAIVKPQYIKTMVNGFEIEGGLQGDTNPKDKDGGTPSLTLKKPESGWFLKFQAKADGWLYVIIKASSNKAYTVFEDGEAIGYSFAAIGNKAPLPEVYSFTLYGAGRFNRLLDAGIEKVEYAEQEYLKIYDPFEYDERFSIQYDGTIKWNNISAVGVGVVKIKVYNNCEYIVNTNGSKIVPCGFVFSPVENVEIESDNTIILKAGNSSTTNPLPKCASPEICVVDGKIKFSCETENVQYVSEIEVGDANKYFDPEITLKHLYKVTVYAYKSGYIRSDKITREIIFTGDGRGNIVGDVDGNGKVNVADHVKLSDIIMKK